MKIPAIFLALSLVSVGAQERVERSEALKMAFFLAMDLTQLQGTPIPTDVDVKHPVALRDGDYGAIVLPETKLSADTIAKAGSTAVPVGQLWLHQLGPVVDGEVVSSSKVRSVKVKAGDDVRDVVQSALAVQSNGTGALELLVYGNSKTPLLKVPLKKISVSQTVPVTMDAERNGDEGKITLKFLGQYEASVPVTELVL